MQLFSSWTGSDFLLFYIALLCACTLAAWWIPVRFRAAGRRSESPDPEVVALLADGHAAYADSVIADLYARGGIGAHGDATLYVTDPGLPASPAGRALLSQRNPFTPGQADDLLSIHANRIAARLRREGLLLRPEQLTRLRWMSATPLVALFLVGLYRQRAGSALGEPTGMLELLLGLTLALAIIRFVRIDQRTTAGIETLRHLRDQSAGLRGAPQPDEAALAVALFGTGVLAGTPWERVHAMRHQAGRSDSAGANGDSADGDGGGCGD